MNLVSDPFIVKYPDALCTPISNNLMNPQSSLRGAILQRSTAPFHLTPDTAIVVKIAFDTRWVAEVNGEPVETFRIGPDLMVDYRW